MNRFTKFKKLLIIGASGHGKVIADIALKMECYSEISFLDDDPMKKNCMNFPIIGKLSDVLLYKNEYDMFIAIGNNEIRRKIHFFLEENHIFIPVLAHPTASVGINADLQPGTAIMAGAVINSEAKIGKSVIINTLASVDHDCDVGNFCHLSPGAHLSGTVKLGENCWVGVGACVKNNLSICDDTTLGAGAVVVKSIDEKGIYIGVPAKRMIKK